MSAANKEFRDGLKATSLFGGVQVFTIIISVIKSKLVAVLLGPTGMGIQGLLDSAAHMVSSFTSLGLGISAVKDISEANASGDKYRVGRTLTVLRKLVWITGVFGFVFFLLLSPLLSKLSFDTLDYVTSFAAIAITLLFTQLSSGQNALLQGTKHFGYMAKSKVIGSFLGLLTVIPLYYFLREKGIVPAIIVASITTLALSWYFSHKVPYEKVDITYKEAVHEGKDMAKMGFFISLQMMLALLISYLVRIFIGRVGGVDDVGLFVAGFAIVDTYVGLVFSSMATEYYPRLATHSKEGSGQFSQAINQQIEISLILVAPLICTFLIFGNWAVVLLYSDKFLPITLMLCFAILGNFFKAPSWCIAYSFLAKGDSKAFLLNEILSMFIGASVKLLFYFWWGLTGIGVACLVTYILYLLQVYIICHIRYEYTPDLTILKLFVPQVSFGIICFALFVYAPTLVRYVAGIAVLAASFCISYRKLSSQVDVAGFVKSRLSRRDSRK